MPDRNSTLQRFIDATEAGIRARAADFPDAMPLADRVFAALEDAGDGNAKTTPARLPACGHLEEALGQAREGPDPVPELADALAAIEPAFAWHRRPGSAQVAGDFHDSHANAFIVGDGGLETRQDVRIGISLVAPDIHYPAHRHPPEELYIVLSPGEWMQEDGPLVLKRSGDLVHNVSNVWHAMHSTDVPLLAVWCLWER
jgi:quercetin dioxygenase-like cupin family protein